MSALTSAASGIQPPPAPTLADSPRGTNTKLWLADTLADHWTDEEMKILERELVELEKAGTGWHQLCITLASRLEKKCVRDVALRLSQMKRTAAGAQLAPRPNTDVALPQSSKLITSKQDAWVQRILQQNVRLINIIRENIVGNRLAENGEYYAQFRSNTMAIESWISGLSVQLPPPIVELPEEFPGSIVGHIGSTTGDGASQARRQTGVSL